jgi:hypothetical protein
MAKIALFEKKETRRPASSQQEEIAKLAYQFFVERGCQHGHDREDWLRAEAVIKNRK